MQGEDMVFRDWYDGIGDSVPQVKNEKTGKRGLFATAGSLSLCIAACYLAGGIFGVGTLSADMTSQPSVPMADDATYVMSWVWDDKTGGADSADSSDGADSADSADGADDPDSGENGEHEAYIRELAEAYIASHFSD